MCREDQSEMRRSTCGWWMCLDGRMHIRCWNPSESTLVSWVPPPGGGDRIDGLSLTVEVEVGFLSLS